MSWRRARSPTAVARRTSRVSVEPRSFSACAPAVTAASRSRASARSSSPYTVLVPRREGWRVSTVKDRPSAAWRRRRSASSGMNRPIASSTSRSSWAGPTLCATWATWWSTYAAASIDRTHGRAGDPAGPPRRQVALDHPGPDPAQAVAELDGLAEVGLAGLGGQPDRGGELGHRELRDQGCTGSGDRHPGLAVVPHGGRLREGVDRVHRRPGHRRLQLPRPPPASARGRSSRTAASTAAAVSRSAVLPVMTQFQHRPPTLRPRKRGSPQGSGKLFSRSFSRRAGRARTRPGRGLDRLDHRGRRGLDRLDHRGLGVVSTGSTTGRRGLDGLDHRGWRGLDRLDHRGSAWSRQARPPRVAWSRQARPPRAGSTTEGRVVSTGSTTEGRRSTTEAAWSRQARPPIGGSTTERDWLGQRQPSSGARCRSTLSRRCAL